MKELLTSKQDTAAQPTRVYEHESIANLRNESIRSLYPDGARAMSSFQESTTKILDQLEILATLMSDQSTVCKHCLEGMKISADRGTVKAAQDLASRWHVYTGEIMETIKAITKVCDAIMIEAVGAPKSPEPSLRIGHDNSAEGAFPELEESWRQYIPGTLNNIGAHLTSWMP